MKARAFVSNLFLAILLVVCVASDAPARPWTDATGQTIEAEYVSSTADTVVVRRTDGQALRLKIAGLNAADREFVATKQAAEKEAQTIKAVVAGEVIWRLPAWNSLSWSGEHPAEIWLYDDKAKAPTEKVADVKVVYARQRNRNQFDGKFKTDGPVPLPKSARLVVKAKFGVTVNANQKDLEELSVPMSLPAAKNGTIDLPAVRLTITR